MMEGALGARGLVARPLDPQLQGAIAVSLARRDLIGRRQRQRDLLGRKRVEQTRGYQPINHLGGDRTTPRRRNVVATAVRAVIVRLAAVIHG